jgi:hypothetical protein
MLSSFFQINTRQEKQGKIIQKYRSTSEFRRRWKSQFLDGVRREIVTMNRFENDNGLAM